MEVRRGGCHCGAIRFEVTGPLDEVLECNCSVCTKKGLLHWIVEPERFSRLAPDAALATYTFGTGIARHTFCPRCGVQPFYSPRSHPDHVDVNVRCLDEVDLRAIRARPFDGRGSWESARAALDAAPGRPTKIRIADKLSCFDDLWNPRVVAALNGQEVKLVKLAGEFVWHAHAAEDELFYVLEGRLRIELRDGAIDLEPGELAVIPRGVEHRPVASETTHVMLFEPASTLNTGDAPNDPRTRRALERV